MYIDNIMFFVLDSTSTNNPATNSRHKKDDPAPYDGVLLNMPAAAKILVEEKYSASEYELRLSFQLDKQAARFRKEIALLNVSIDSMTTTNQLLLDLKDQEIIRLQDLVLEESNDYSAWWAAGGAAAGILITIGMFFLVKEISSSNTNSQSPEAPSLSTTEGALIIPFNPTGVRLH